ncbi:MAG TPA: hypothetical protein PK402_01430, partial [Tepidisphaeraceae bacterium]|nr:hypothetical protein [Tepidisphaeraceae bacterium]
MLIHSMTDKPPIDYARAESADVVRKKFRRRVVTFLVATVVVVVIGGGWVHAARVGGFSIGNFYSYSMRAAGMGEIVELPGPEREDLGPENWLYGRTIGDSTVGVWLTQFNSVSWTGGVSVRSIRPPAARSSTSRSTCGQTACVAPAPKRAAIGSA